MLLGQMIEHLADDAFAAEALLSLGDLPLLVDVEAACREQETVPSPTPRRRRGALPTTLRTRTGWR